MKIAFFSDDWIPNKDGIVTSMLNYRSELEKRGHQVFIFASADSKTIKQNADPHVFLFRSLAFPPYPQYKIALFPFPSKKYVHENNIEIVHCHGIASMGVAALKTASDLDLPSVATFHTLLPSATRIITNNETGQKIAATIAWKAIEAFYSKFDLVTVPSHVIRTTLKKKCGIESIVAPNAVDTERFNPEISGESVRNRLKLHNDEKLVLVAGRTSREKNIDVVIRAARLVDDARFVIVGDGPAKKELMQLVEREGLQKKIVFTGLVSDELLPHYYAACDVFVTASTFETQGIALLEAMACGKPVIGADAMAIPEAVTEGKNGFLFQPFNNWECAEKIESALHCDPDKKKELSQNARATAETYSIPASTSRLFAVYKKLVR